MSPLPPFEESKLLVRPYRRLRAAAEEPAHGVTDADIRAIFRTLVKQAVAGNQEAAREVLDRFLGRPVESEVLRRLEAAEARLTALDRGGS